MGGSGENWEKLISYLRRVPFYLDLFFPLSLCLQLSEYHCRAHLTKTDEYIEPKHTEQQSFPTWSSKRTELAYLPAIGSFPSCFLNLTSNNLSVASNWGSFFPYIIVRLLYVLTSLVVKDLRHVFGKHVHEACQKKFNAVL